MRSEVWIVALVIVAAAPTRAAVLGLGSSIDEIVDRQSVGMQSAFFGSPHPAGDYGHSVSLLPFVGAHGNDGILAGVGVTWRAARVVPWDVGMGVSVADTDFVSWTIALSSARRVWRGVRSQLVLESVLAYQFFDGGSGDRTAITFGEQGSLDEAEVLIRSFDFFHAMAHAVYAVDLWRLRPVVDLGWVGTRYRLDGNEWEGGFPIVEGAARDEAGTQGKMTLGIGLSLDLEPTTLFGGLQSSGSATAFQGGIGIEF